MPQSTERRLFLRIPKEGAHPAPRGCVAESGYRKSSDRFGLRNPTSRDTDDIVTRLLDGPARQVASDRRLSSSWEPALAGPPWPNPERENGAQKRIVTFTSGTAEFRHSGRPVCARMCHPEVRSASHSGWRHACITGITLSVCDEHLMRDLPHHCCHDCRAGFERAVVST